MERIPIFKTTNQAQQPAKPNNMREDVLSLFWSPKRQNWKTFITDKNVQNDPIY